MSDEPYEEGGNEWRSGSVERIARYQKYVDSICGTVCSAEHLELWEIAGQIAWDVERAVLERTKELKAALDQATSVGEVWSEECGALRLVDIFHPERVPELAAYLRAKEDK